MFGKKKTKVIDHQGEKRRPLTPVEKEYIRQDIQATSEAIREMREARAQSLVNSKVEENKVPIFNLKEEPEYQKDETSTVYVDGKKVHETVVKATNLILETQKNVSNLTSVERKELESRFKAMSDEEMRIAASIIPGEILFDALRDKYKKLEDLEERVQNLL